MFFLRYGLFRALRECAPIAEVRQQSPGYDDCRLAMIASPIVAFGEDFDDRKDCISWRSACFCAAR
jgi:hypothetical protein